MDGVALLLQLGLLHCTLRDKQKRVKLFKCLDTLKPIELYLKYLGLELGLEI